VNVSGILSANFETNIIPPSEMSQTEHSWLESASPEIQAVMYRRRRVERSKRLVTGFMREPLARPFLR
jgi:hypothetical protein